VRLDGTVKKIGKRGDVGGLVWLPSENAIRFLETTPIHVWGQRMDPDIAARLKKNGWEPDPVFRRVLCRIRLRSPLIWIEHKNNERIYLNAEHLGVRGSLTGRELLLASPDPQRAADLDIFIYLSLPQLKVKIETKNANTKKTEPKVEGKP
jgi:hypothetical protein